MLCKACNTQLNDTELSQTEVDTGDFVDLCSPCYAVSERTSNNYDIDASDFDVEFNDGLPQPTWLR